MGKKINILSTKELTLSQLQLFNNDVVITHRNFVQITLNKLSPHIIKHPISNVVITSKNALKSLLMNFSKEKFDFQQVFCVGEKTKLLIEKEVKKVTRVEKNTNALADYLIGNFNGEVITYFCGNLRSQEFSKALKKNNINVSEIETYQTVLNPLQMTKPFNGILFFSPSAVISFMEKNTVKDAVAFCIGETTATEAEKYFSIVKAAKIATIESVIRLSNREVNLKE